MGQRIPWMQYGLIVTIAGAPWARAAWKKCNCKKKKFHIVTTNEKLVVNYFFLVLHMSPPRWGLHFLRLWYSWIWRRSARTPKNYEQNYQSSDGGPYVQGYQDAHKWRPHHIGDIYTTRFSYMSYNVTKCTFLASFFGGGGGRSMLCLKFIRNT